MDTAESSSKKNTLLALKTLKDEFNLCFKWGDAKLPIALGIHHHVLAHYENDVRFSKTNLKKAIGLYTSSRVYLEKEIEGAVRIDLLGKEVGIVAKEEAENALFLLLKRKKQ